MVLTPPTPVAYHNMSLRMLSPLSIETCSVFLPQEKQRCCRIWELTAPRNLFPLSPSPSFPGARMALSDLTLLPGLWAHPGPPSPA